MLLAIDIGNTNVVLALLDAEDRVLEERRAPSKDGWTAEQYAAGSGGRHGTGCQF